MINDNKFNSIKIYKIPIQLENTVGFCLFSCDFPTELEHSLCEMNEILISTELKNNNKQIRLTNMIDDIIQIHGEAIELSFYLFNFFYISSS